VPGDVIPIFFLKGNVTAGKLHQQRTMADTLSKLDHNYMNSSSHTPKRLDKLRKRKVLDEFFHACE
jgi:hypothetical protein